MNSRLRLLLLALALAATPGCALLPRKKPPPEVRPVAQPGIFAEVVKVGADGRHVILACTFPPAQETTARVFRGGQVVGRVELTGWSRRHYLAANVLEGTPQVGDFVRP